MAESGKEIFKNAKLGKISNRQIIKYGKIGDNIGYELTKHNHTEIYALAFVEKKDDEYVYDYDKYMSENGINLDPVKVLPTCTSRNIKDLFEIIKNDSYDIKAYESFRKKYLPKELGNSTKLIVDYIFKNISK